jgi:transposase
VPASRIAPTWPAAAGSGKRGKIKFQPRGWSSWTRPPPSQGQALGQDEYDPHPWPLRKGQRLIATVPQGRRRTLTFVAGLRCDHITAPCLLDGPIDAESFRAWLEQLLVPTLRPGDIVAMDNLSSHKDPAIRRAFRSTGAKLFYLPQYSPELNPIEQAFAKLKTLLRKHNARSFEELEAAIRHLLPKLTPQQCANFFSEAGYAAT